MLYGSGVVPKVHVTLWDPFLEFSMNPKTPVPPHFQSSPPDPLAIKSCTFCSRLVSGAKEQKNKDNRSIRDSSTLGPYSSGQREGFSSLKILSVCIATTATTGVRLVLWQSWEEKKEYLSPTLSVS